MIFVGQEKTQFGKICSHSITFVTTYFSWKNYVTPPDFSWPPIRKNMTAPLSLSHTKTMDECGSLA